MLKSFMVNHSTKVAGSASMVIAQAAASATNSLLTILLNRHDVRYYEIIKMKKKKRYMVVEEMNYVNMIRDKLHPEKIEEDDEDEVCECGHHHE